MPLTLSGSGGITYPDGSVNTTRSVSTAGDTITGPLTINGAFNHLTNSDFVMQRSDAFDYSFVTSALHNNANKSVYFQNAGGGPINGNWVFRGKVLKPEQPAFAIGANNNGVVTSGSACPFNQTSGNSINIGGHFNTSNYRFTAPVGGRYFFSFSIYGFGSYTSTFCLAVNGAYYRLGGDVVLGFKASADSDLTVGYSAVVSLNTGDYVTVIARPGVGDAYMYGPHSIFTGYFLG